MKLSNKAKSRIGWAMLATPFIVIFGFLAIAIGILKVVLIFAGAIGSVIWIKVGVDWSLAE